MRVANAPCSWGVLEFGLEGAAAGARRVLSEMSRAGFAGTELGDWGFLPTEPGALRDVLAEHHLALLGAYLPIAFADPAAHAEGIEAAIRTARLLAGAADTPFLVLADRNGSLPDRTAKAGRISPADGLDAATMDLFARGVDRVAAAVLDETGVRSVFHHHCGGWIETPDEVAALLDQTDPTLVGLCLDTGHWAFGGGDPLGGLERHAPRVWHVHFKDCSPDLAAQSRREGWDYFESVRQGVFCELGRGSVPFPRIAEALSRMGYDGWIVVEQDVLPGMGTPFESAVRNRSYLRKMGF
jgi:inosose dehydratase